MKKIFTLVFLVFLTASLFAEWKEIKVPSNAVHTVQAFENDECEVVERNFPEKDYHDIIIVFKDDKFYTIFEYSDVIMLIIKTDDYFTRNDVFTLIDMYGALQTGNMEKN